MRRTFTWVAVAGAVVALAAILLLQTSTTSSEPMTLSSSGLCSGLQTRGGGMPDRAPDHAETFDLADGDRFTILKAPGIWRGRLHAENVSSAPMAPDGEHHFDDSWTSVHNYGWCQLRATEESFLARGAGRVTWSVWEGEDDTFRVR